MVEVKNRRYLVTIYGLKKVKWGWTLTNTESFLDKEITTKIKEV